MPTTLTKDQRSALEKLTLKAREAAETAARSALENLAVHEASYRAHMDEGARRLRNRLRARGRALGDRLDPIGTQAIDQLAEAAAYEHWHRLLFTRFLADNHLLHTGAEHGGVPVTLAECDELAPELGARDGFDVACRFASETLPGIFRQDDPVLDLRLAPNHEVQLRRLLDDLPAETFRTDDALGWTYQFWQATRKKQVNESGVKIGARELPAVTQLFTEDYMVEFLLHNSLGAWWAGKRMKDEGGRMRFATEEDARRFVALPGCPWEYLRFVKVPPDDEPSDSPSSFTLHPSSFLWTPAAGTFDGWPKRAAEIRFLDPCMGSGHFLVFALPILARLRMEEEGLSAAEAVAAVLRDNLHGLEIDERCTQIAAFNVALTAWKLGGYQSLPTFHLACSGLAPNTRETDWLAIAGANEKLRNGMERLYRLFQQAAVLGSLINPRAGKADLLEAGFQELQPLLEKAMAQETKDDTAHEVAVTARGLAKAAEILAGQFTLVATNVPYVTLRKQTPILNSFAKDTYPAFKQNLATSFVARFQDFCADSGVCALVTPQDWLFLDIYEEMRRSLLLSNVWNYVIRLGTKAFRSPMWDMNILLFICSASKPHANSGFTAEDVSEFGSAEHKADALLQTRPVRISQMPQLENPDARIVFEKSREAPTLSQIATALMGVSTGDGIRFNRNCWEVPILETTWDFLQSTVNKTQPFGGGSEIIRWEQGRGEIYELAQSVRHLNHSAQNWARGRPSWGRVGVVISQMGDLSATRYLGNIYDCNCCAIIPHDHKNLLALWSFCETTQFCDEVRVLNQALKVPPHTLLKIPFDLAHWQKVAAEKYPHGLPKPFSSDPTQWLFNGHPKGSDEPLQVAVARLLGYRWPRQTGSEFPDCPALGPDGLEPHADTDGIVCLPPINKEAPAAVRLRALFAAALGADWTAGTERDLLAATGAKQTNLDDWLRDSFFEQHCNLFHNRPFVWQLWDGRKDGFHALVNYHRLDHANLQKLTYSYLGDWIRQQESDARADKPGAAERLGAARALEQELMNILEGEPPYDLFIRWKPLKDQPLGWQPDLNDGVRLNIRPFMQARDLGKKGAGILRAKPNIKWDKDRGTEPQRAKADYPWFWHADEPPLACPGGPDSTGNRWNNVHLTLARKRAAAANNGA